MLQICYHLRPICLKITQFKLKEDQNIHKDKSLSPLFKLIELLNVLTIIDFLIILELKNFIYIVKLIYQSIKYFLIKDFNDFL